MNGIHLCYEGHYRALRNKLLDIAAADKDVSAGDVARMSDRDVVRWFEERGYVSYVAYMGEYDDSEDILIVKTDAIDALVREGDALWVKRCCY